MNVSDREKRDLLLLAGIVFFGVILMFVAGQFAVRLLPSWNVSSDMGSKIEISGELANVSAVGLAPLRPEILTPPVWQRTFLTPLADDLDELNEVPVVVIAPVTMVPTRVATSQTQPTQASGATVTATQAPTLTPFPTNTLFYVFPTSTFTPRPPTSTFTRTVTPSMTLTRTPTFTPTITSTRTSTFTPTFTPTWTATFTSTFTATNSPSPTATATNTFTPSPTFTASPTATNTFTPSPTFTSTPNTEPDFGATDGQTFTLGDNSSYTFYFSPITVAGDIGDYEIVYYEREYPENSGQIQMDRVYIEIGDGTDWYIVFYWGDGWANPNSNLNIGNVPEPDNYVVSMSSLYGSPYQTGVTIDIDGDSDGTGSNVAPPSGFVFDRIRITAPAGGGDGCDIDAIQIFP